MWHKLLFGGRQAAENKIFYSRFGNRFNQILAVFSFLLEMLPKIRYAENAVRACQRDAQTLFIRQIARDNFRSRLSQR